MKRPFTIYDLPASASLRPGRRLAIGKNRRGGTGVTPVKSGVAPDLGQGGIHHYRSACALRRGFGRDARNDRRDACSTRFNHQSQRGVALVITVILLAVVTLMALTFLAISRRERNAVATTTDTATAKLAADDALAAAEAQITANTLAATNPYNFGLLVSTNYINPLGFTPNSASPTNVNYDYLTLAAGGGSLNQNDFLQNLANLYYLPRAPVYATNYIYHTDELQFYLDLNRNGVFDTNNFAPGAYTAGAGPVGDPEWIGVLQHPGQPYGPNNPFVARYTFVAVPIGNALDLNAIYNDAMGIKGGLSMGGGNDGFLRNQGVGSWEINLAAFLADLNYNEWGQIVGSGASSPPGSANWYQYNEPIGNLDQGIAFDQALSLLSYRYGYNYYTLRSVGGLNGLFTIANTLPPFQDNIDYYSDAQPPMTTPAGINVGNQDITYPWSGADNTNHFFDLQELYNTNSAYFEAFASRLLAAGNAYNLNNSDPTNFYNRYTYYRLLSQMGVDSAPEQDQINLNYRNAIAYFARYQNGNIITGDVTNIVTFPNAETNLVPWDPLQFFTIAADKMLHAYSQEWITESPSNYVATYCMTTNISTASDPVAYPTNVPVSFGISDIPVVISNRFVYTPAIQRVLQLAANIYDATTNNATANTPDFPSVFRPIFYVTNDFASGYTNIYIAGYEPVQTLVNGVEQIGAVSGTGDYQLALPVNVADLLNPSYQTAYYGYSSISAGSGIYTNVNVYGVPWIIGAKKGFPNFNEFAMESVFQLTRKVEVTRPATNSPSTDYSYNQMFNLSLSNQFGVECWNSYTNDYLRSADIYVRDTCTGLLTNNEGFGTPLAAFMPGFLQINSASNNNNGWPGYNLHGNGAAVFLTPASFQLPLDTNVLLITNSTYRFNQAGSVPEPGYIPGRPYLTTNLFSPYEVNVVDPLTGARYPQPHWWLYTTNNIQAYILDTQTTPYHVIDYVQLSGPNSIRDLTSEIITNYDTPVVSSEASGGQLWNTNFQAGVPIGILSQVQVSLDHTTPSISSGTWDTTQPDTQNGIDAFRAFYHISLRFNNVSGEQAIAAAYMTNAIQSPYTPTATVVQHIDWQANDPLVHYLAGDLNWPQAVVYDRAPASLTSITNNTSNLGQLNTRYAPWGGNPLHPPTGNAYNLAVKDPLVWQSDDWDFPTYKFPTVGWLGRVHRGTPWQTVYLKSPNILAQTNGSGAVIGPNTWASWTGDTLTVTNGNLISYFDGENTAPVQDQLLFDLFTTAPNANATRGTLSVNVGASDPGNPQAGLAAWSALFSGVQVLSNDAPAVAVDPASANILQHNGTMTYYTPFPINPAGPVNPANPPALWQMVTNINGTRTNFVNADGLKGTFEHVGDILSVPDLSDHSPFLNWNNVSQQKGGISDEMYEWLPQQVMSLLRVSGTPQSPMRYVIYCYGQALKPAPNGIYTGGGSYFGMVTNYQVVAESASRAVVNFGSVMTNVVTVTTNTLNNIVLYNTPQVTNNTAQIEQFNVLPPY